MVVPPIVPIVQFGQFEINVDFDYADQGCFCGERGRYNASATKQQAWPLTEAFLAEHLGD